MPDQMIYVSKSHAGTFRLAKALAAELPSWSLSELIGSGLKRQLDYMASFYPEAMERARARIGP